MKKLLAITPHLSTGGAPQVLVKRIELIKDDYEIYVIEYSNISHHFVIQKNRIKNLIPEERFFTIGEDKTSILPLIEMIKPDIIHMEEIPEMFMDYKIASIIYAKNRNYKIFETTHSSDYDVNNKMFFPDKFIFVSQYNCFKFNKFGIPTEVVEYPVEKKIKDPADKRKAMDRLGLDPTYKHVLNVGLFTPRKNQSYAFDIARKLENEKIKIHFVGNQAGNFEYYWKPLMNNKPSNCVIWGERGDVDDFYTACDLFLFTSMGFRYDKELNPLVIKEALQEDIPLFLFPLDVYCGKYDDEESCTYMVGNSDDDSKLVKNFLFGDKKINYNVKLVNLIDSESRQENIKSFADELGLNYIQNKCVSIETIDSDNCLRQNDIGRLGVNGLDIEDYEDYLSFRKSIETELTPEVDFLIVCKDWIVSDIDGIIDNMVKNDISYVTDCKGKSQFIILNKKSKNFIFSKLRTEGWDKIDRWLKYVYEDNSDNLNVIDLREMSEDYMNIKYDEKDTKVIFKLKDDQQEKKFKLVFKNEGSVLYKTEYNISSKYESWSKIDKIKGLKFIDIDFFDGDNYLFSKRLKTGINIDKSKELFIVSTYPNSKKKKEVTINCLEKLKQSGRKTMLSSHMPLDESLQDYCDYYIYDSYNPLINHTLYNNYWYETNEFRADIVFDKLSKKNNLNQTLTVLNNIENSVRMAKSLGYKRIINVTYDYIFSDNDLSKIDDICQTLNDDNKNGYFMQFEDNNLDTLKTVFFIIDVDLFLDVFDNPRTEEIFNKECSDLGVDNFLERYFYKKLEKYNDRLFIEKTTEEKLFDGSINIFSGVEYLTILPIRGSDDEFVIWLSTNNKIDRRKMVIDVYNNNDKINTYEHIIDKKTHFYKEIKVEDEDNIELKVKFVENFNSDDEFDTMSEKLLDTEYFGIINKNNMKDMLSNRGLFSKKTVGVSMNTSIQDGVDYSIPTVGYLDEKIEEIDTNLKSISTETQNLDNITTIINYKTMDYDKIKNVIDSVKPISSVVKVCLSDRLYDGTIENEELIDKTIEENHKDNVDFIQYEYDEDMDNKDEDYWDNISRSLGAKYSENESEWILFINSDEIIITNNFNIFFDNKNEKDMYLLSKGDSPLLIKRSRMNLIGNRFDIVSNSDGDKVIDVQGKYKVKLYKN